MSQHKQQRYVRPFGASALLLALATAGCDVAAAQSFSEDVSVTVVEVPVQVIRNGEPIRGLTRDDFVVYDHGVERRLVAFEVIDTLRLDRRQETRIPSEIASPEASEAPETAVARGRNLLFLFDFQFAPRWRIKRSVLGARRLFERGLDDSDRIAIVMYTGSAGANILVGFTRNPAELELGLAFIEALADGRRKSLERARTRLIEYWTATAGTAGDERGADSFLRLARRLGPAAAVALSGGGEGGEVMSLAEYDRISGAGPGGPGGGGSGSGLSQLVGPRLIDDRATELEDLISLLEKYGNALAELATLLRDVPQPKHLIYFSEGFPTEVLTNKETQGRALSRVGAATRAMQDTGWAIHAIDLEGVPDTLAAGGRSAENFADPAPTSFITGGARGDLVPATGRGGFDAEALAHLATETGGILIENFNNIESAASEILQATAVTYLLAFQPEDLEADGSYHRLEVKLVSKIPGARLHHRAGYSAPTPVGRRTATERAMDEARLVTGDDSFSGLQAASLVVAPRPRRDAAARVSFVVDLEAAGLAPAGADGKLALELEAYAFDDQDSLLDLLTRRLSLDLERLGERLRRGGLKLTGSLDLPPGRHRVRIIVRETGGDRVFARSHPVEVVGAQDPTALPPLLLAAGREPLLLEVGETAWKSLGLPGRTTAPAAAPALAEGAERRLVFIFYPPPDSKPRLGWRVLDGAGRPVEGAEVTWEQRVLGDGDDDGDGDGADRLVGLFEAGTLAPGRYSIELSMTARDGAAPIVTASPFTIVTGG